MHDAKFAGAWLDPHARVGVDVGVGGVRWLRCCGVLCPTILVCGRGRDQREAGRKAERSRAIRDARRVLRDCSKRGASLPCLTMQGRVP